MTRHREYQPGWPCCSYCAEGQVWDDDEGKGYCPAHLHYAALKEQLREEAVCLEPRSVTDASEPPLPLSGEAQEPQRSLGPPRGLAVDTAQQGDLLSRPDVGTALLWLESIQREYGPEVRVKGDMQLCTSDGERCVLLKAPVALEQAALSGYIFGGSRNE